MSQQAKEELLQLKSNYCKFKIRSEKGKWPLQFSLALVPEKDIKIDPTLDGLVFVFEMSEHYPNSSLPSSSEEGSSSSTSSSSSDRGCKLLNIENYTPNEKSPKLASIMLSNMFKSANKQFHKICTSSTTQQQQQQFILKFMKWADSNITSLILTTGNAEYFTNYLVEGMHGISERRYQIDFSKYPKSEQDGGDDDNDDEIPALDFYSLMFPPPELSESSSSSDDCLLLIQGGGDCKNCSIFEMKQASFLVKCDRCAHDCEIRNVKAGEQVEKNCPKCAKTLQVLMKPFGMTSDSLSTTTNAITGEVKKGNEIQAGTPFVYFELVNCTFFDLIPSSSTGNVLQVLCFNCSHANDLKNLKIKSLNEMNCSHCHELITIQLNQLQKRSVGEYLSMITHNSGSSGAGGGGSNRQNDENSRKKKKSSVLKGICVGAPLPFFGTCEHYKNSKRWFRFDCCGRAYPCDICHEKECTAPSSEIMGRKMICGYCSREQGLAQTCHHCKKNLIKKISEKSSSSSRK